MYAYAIFWWNYELNVWLTYNFGLHELQYCYYLSLVFYNDLEIDLPRVENLAIVDQDLKSADRKKFAWQWQGSNPNCMND